MAHGAAHVFVGMKLVSQRQCTIEHHMEQAAFRTIFRIARALAFEAQMLRTSWASHAEVNDPVGEIDSLTNAFERLYPLQQKTTTVTVSDAAVGVPCLAVA